jgi:hypothetical protein
MRAPDRAAQVATSGSGGILDGNGTNPSTFAPWLKSRVHAPKTFSEVTATARTLIASGFGDHSVAAILALDVNAIRALIGRRE